MKNKSKGLPIQLIVVSAISVIGMAGVVLACQFTRYTTREPALVPTDTVNSQKGVGGRPTPSGNQSPQPNTAPAKKVDNPQPVPITGSSPNSTTKLDNPAPRQAAIKSAVKHEFAYKALATPNDTYYPQSWAMQHTNAQAAWNVSTGNPIVVAVIDTGFALQHEDLAAQWHINTGETGNTSSGDRCWTGTPQNKSTNGCDDDNNGYADDWRGWNFSVMNNYPQAGQTPDGGADLSHGTSVSGLVGAVSNNGKGVASYNWNTHIMPLQALDDGGNGTTSDVVAAIYYAVDNGASVINMSLGGPYEDPDMQAAVDYAYAHNVVVVAAAGNCGTTGDAGCGGFAAPMMLYPALCNHVISVGATDATDKRASFSSYGPGLDVVAPGSGSIISPIVDTRTPPFNYSDAYSANLYGTSFASPIVTSVVSLVKSLRPSASVDDITALIDGSATKVASMGDSLYSNAYGHGLVNAATAATITSALASSTPATPQLGQTGDYRSEHSFSAATSMSSGCTVAAGTYCTIRMTNDSGFDRYLPYKLGNTQGQAGWSWPGLILNNGEWSVRAVQGSRLSPTYWLFSK